MNTMQEAISIEQLEEAFLAIADGTPGAVASLRKLLEPLLEQPKPSRTVTTALADSFGVVADDREQLADTSEGLELVLDLARLGVESLMLRDALAAACRKVFSSYPDPAGLLRALGIHDVNVKVTEVASRWERFGLLEEGAYLWHHSFGLGKLAEIDGFSDLFGVQFTQRQSFSLAACLTTMSVLKPGTVADQLLGDGTGAKPPETCVAAFVKDMAASFLPPVAEPMAMIEAVLVPRYILPRSFNSWRNRGEDVPSSDSPGGGRTWKTARSLEELKVLLKGLEQVTPDDATIESLSKIYRFSAHREKFQPVLAETLATLREMSPDDDTWLDRILVAMPKDTIVWASQEAFCKVTSKLPARLRLSWLKISLRARGEEWFLTNVMSLPHRYWVTAEEIIGVDSDSHEHLRKMVFDHVRRGQSNADAAVWLWNQPEETKSRAAFYNPVSVFRILSQPVAGDYIKARKDLFDLLMNDETFQTQLMQGGSQEGISSFVRAIKSSSLLQKGEQQSLLVKIVRIFPSARDVVEERQEVVAKRPIAKVTSYRSMKERHDELQEIINKKIPANSAAIAHARSYGDLRENAEYKAAKDEQRYLMARRRELERDLKEVMATDFTEVAVGDTVVPGVTAVLEVNGEPESYYICGLWDSSPEKHIISYETPLGRKLIGLQVGGTVEINADRSGVLKAIEPLPGEIMQQMKVPE